VSGSSDPASLAIGLGGVILGYRAFAQLATGIVSLSGALIAFRQIAPLHDAAACAEPPGLPDFASTSAGGAKVEAHELTFRYDPRGEPILSRASVEIEPGDRILLEGPSGGGKSTLAAVLAGLRKPDAGVVLLGGLDFAALGAETWRRRVAAAPQFQDNHLLIETFQFNLLMGAEFPPTRQALREAEAICTELGLDPVLRRMPSGMLQMVGETGWQLSHGERSRVYIARALLQDADLVIVDENFGALDPENLERALRCVMARARSLLVIAHP
jgi:ATP-binding cassette subfamily B protein